MRWILLVAVGVVAIGYALLRWKATPMVPSDQTPRRRRESPDLRDCPADIDLRPLPDLDEDPRPAPAGRPAS